MPYGEKVDELFERLSKEYIDLDDTSKEVLSAYCKTVVLYNEAVDDLAREGIIVETEKGPKENPLLGAVHKLSNEVKGLYVPLKRILFKQQDRAVEDELDDFLGI